MMIPEEPLLSSKGITFVDEALVRASKDNLTIQILRIEQLPNHDLEELNKQASTLPYHDRQDRDREAHRLWFCKGCRRG